MPPATATPPRWAPQAPRTPHTPTLAAATSPAKPHHTPLGWDTAIYLSNATLPNGQHRALLLQDGDWCSYLDTYLGAGAHHLAGTSKLVQTSDTRFLLQASSKEARRGLL